MEKDTELWRDLHAKDDTPWHRNEDNPKLKKHLTMLTSKCGSKSQTGPSTIFVPLCGRSKDLLYLYQLGHTVIGCEAVEKPVRQFFQESKLEFEEKKTGVGFTLQTKDGRLRVLCCDFFDLTKDLLGGEIDTVWDRASMGALSQEMAKRYVNVMRHLLSEDFKILLVTVYYEPGTRQGPPFSYSFAQMKELYGDFCSIQVVENRAPEGDFNLNYFFLTPLKGKKDKMAIWNKMWTEDPCNIWTRKTHNKHLECFYHQISKDPQAKQTIFVPLCGKTYDMMWLWQKGHTVIGLEGVAFVVEELFVENKLEFSKEQLESGEGFKFQTSDGRLVIFCCDLFKMEPQMICDVAKCGATRKVDAVWDRGSLAALDVSDRQRYVDFIFELLDKSGQFDMLLNVYHFPDEPEFQGPPTNMPEEVVKELYGTHAKVDISFQGPDEDMEKLIPNKNIVNTLYHIYKR